MTAVFRIGSDGNGTIYYDKTEEEINSLVKSYEKRGYKVQPLGAAKCDTNQKWFQID